MLKFARLLMVVGLAVLAGYATAQEKGSAFTQASEDAPIVHVLSSFSFPAQIGGFRRGEPTQFNEAGDDVSMAYYEDAALIVVTLYVYPTHGSTLADEFIARKNEVSHVHPDAELISSATVAVTPKHVKASSASYAFAGEFAGKERKLRSELLVAQSGKWFVEYRISYPAENQAIAAPKIKKLLQTFAWP